MLSEFGLFKVVSLIVLLKELFIFNILFYVSCRYSFESHMAIK
jgi:hypothetical protein